MVEAMDEAMVEAMDEAMGDLGPPSVHLLWTGAGPGTGTRRASGPDGMEQRAACDESRGGEGGSGEGGGSVTWTRSLYSLGRASGQAGKSTLVGWLTGDAARAVSGRPSEELLPEALTSLSHVWEAIGWVPTACFTSSWASDRHIGGSYSFPRVDAAPDVADQLAAPLCDGTGEPRVVFCGEATSRAHFGTVHGALSSGEREARRLLERWSCSEVPGSDLAQEMRTRRAPKIVGVLQSAIEDEAGDDS